MTQHCWFGPFLWQQLRWRGWTEDDLAACLIQSAFIFPNLNNPRDPKELADRIRDIVHCRPWQVSDHQRPQILRAIIMCLGPGCDAAGLRKALADDIIHEASGLPRFPDEADPDPVDDENDT